MVVNQFRPLDVCGYGFGNYSSDGALRHVTVWWWLAGFWWCALGFFAVSSSCFRSKFLLVLHLWSFCCNVLVYTTTTTTPLRMGWKKIVWQKNMLGVQCDGRHMCGHGTVGGQPFCQYQLGLRLALCQPWNGSQHISTKQGNCIHLDLECKYRHHLRCEQQQQQAPISIVVQPVWTCSSSSVQPLWACSQLLGRRLCCWIGRLCKCTNGESFLFQLEAYKCKEMTLTSAICKRESCCAFIFELLQSYMQSRIHHPTKILPPFSPYTPKQNPLKIAQHGWGQFGIWHLLW